MQKKGTGALVRIECDTLQNTLSFQITDGQGQRHARRRATIRNAGVPLPRVFKELVRSE